MRLTTKTHKRTWILELLEIILTVKGTQILI